jgi:hypothetical protein
MTRLARDGPARRKREWRYAIASRRSWRSERVLGEGWLDYSLDDWERVTTWRTGRARSARGRWLVTTKILTRGEKDVELGEKDVELREQRLEDLR